MEEELADLIREIIGSREAVQAILQGSEYAMVRGNTDLWSPFWGSVRRKRERVEVVWWEAIGVITYNLLTKELANDMEQVPPEQSQLALNITKAEAVPGRLPKFDEKVFGSSTTAAHPIHGRLGA